MRIKRKLRLFLFLLISALLVGASYLYFVNKNYISSLQAIASEGISTANYGELSEIIKKLPITKKVFSAGQYRSLYGNEQVRGIYRAGDRVMIDLIFKENKDNDPAKRSAVINFNLPDEVNMEEVFLLASLGVEGGIAGSGHQGSRALIELYDYSGKVMYGPHMPVVRGSGKTYLVLKPTTSEPIPIGSVEDGFDLKRVAKVAVRFAVGRYPDGISKLPAAGKIYLDDIFLVTNIRLISSLFQKPDQRRITQDTLDVIYQIRKFKWRTESGEFLVGINYPWNNYGWDIGRNPYGQPANSGWSANLSKMEEDFRLFKESGINVVRIFLFCDLRTGLKYQDNRIYGFDEYVWRDVESIFVAAQKADIKIIPVLFDFSIADGGGRDLGVGEHPELIFYSQKQDLLVHLLRPMLQAMNVWNHKYGEPVFAVDLINEPENMAMILVPEYFGTLKNWLKDITNIIHKETSFKVTLGSRSLTDMRKWWSDMDIDVWQFHFYKYMTVEYKTHPLNQKRKEINLPGLIIGGEIEPYDIAENMQTLKDNGYNGAFLWSWNSTDGFGMKSSEEYKELAEWIKISKTATKQKEAK